MGFYTSFVLGAVSLVISSCPAPSDNIIIGCPDTTNHSFVWDVDTLGLYGSIARDIAIINESDIWVVGLFYLNDPDSSYDGTGRETFNAVHWNGHEWIFDRFLNGSELYGIQYFSENDIWVSSGTPYHWNGQEWTFYHLWNMGVLVEGDVTEIWGRAPDDVYFAGRTGTLVHFDGSNFSRIETSTAIDFNSLSGDIDGPVVVTGANNVGESGSVAVQHYNSISTILYDRGDYQTSEYGNILCVGFDTEQFLLACNKGVIKYNPVSQEFNLLTKDDLQWEHYNSVRVIKAQAHNDVVMVSGYGGFMYYNGKTWNSRTNLEELVSPDGSFLAYGMDYNNNIAVIGGVLSIYRNAIIIIGIDVNL